MSYYHNGPADESPLLSMALRCLRCGLSVIPIDHTSKRPASQLLPRNGAGKPTWKPYQEGIASEESVRQWAHARIRSLAVVAGRVSGGLLVIDFDVPRFYDAWVAAVGQLADG